MGKTDWEVVTNYTDIVTTTLKTVTFPKVQEQVYVRNQGNANFTYTIGSQSGTLAPGQSVTVKEDISSFTLQAVSGTHTFELRANEKGTEREEIDPSDVSSKLNNLINPYNYDGAVITLTFDDGPLQDITNVKPVLDSKGIKATFGVITSYVGTTLNGTTYMTKDQLTQLKNEGHDIVSHSKSHASSVFQGSNATNATEAAIDVELLDAKKWLDDNGFSDHSDVLIFPWGNFTDQVKFKKVARKYYKNAMNALGSYNTSPNDNMYLDRVFVNSSPAFSTYQTTMDSAKTNKGLLIFGFHSHDATNFSISRLTEIIDYAQSLGIPILPFSEAIKLKGNVLSIGEFTDSANSFFLDKKGGIKSAGVSGDFKTVVTTSVVGVGNNLDSKINLFPLNASVTRISSSADSLTTKGGTLFAFRGGDYYGYQLYHTVDNRFYFRTWNSIESSGSWNSWIEITNPPIKVIKGSYTAIAGNTLNDSITKYDKYKVTYAHITSAVDTLASEGGVMETYRGEEYYAFQKFVSAVTGKIYSRVWSGNDATGAWTTWKQVTTT